MYTFDTGPREELLRNGRVVFGKALERLPEKWDVVLVEIGRAHV